MPAHPDAKEGLGELEAGGPPAGHSDAPPPNPHRETRWSMPAWPVISNASSTSKRPGRRALAAGVSHVGRGTGRGAFRLLHGDVPRLGHHRRPGRRFLVRPDHATGERPLPVSGRPQPDDVTPDLPGARGPIDRALAGRATAHDRDGAVPGRRSSCRSLPAQHTEAIRPGHRRLLALMAGGGRDDGQSHRALPVRPAEGQAGHWATSSRSDTGSTPKARWRPCRSAR